MLDPRDQFVAEIREALAAYRAVNRSDGTLTYAGSQTEGNVTTTIIGSGHCEAASIEKT